MGTLLRAVTAVLLCCLATNGWAAQGPFLGGMEMELSGDVPLGNIFENFTIRVPQPAKLVEALNDSVIDDYLTPQTWERLPKEVQERLSAGLKVGVALEGRNSPALLSRDGKSPLAPGKIFVPGAENASAKPVIDASLPRSEARIQLPGAPSQMERSASGLILPESARKAAPPRQIELTESQRADLNWNEITRRWKAIPISERRSWIDIDLLPKLVRASFFKYKLIDGPSLSPRTGIPVALKDFFSKLNWSRDPDMRRNPKGGPLEFRHSRPVSDPEVLIKDIQRFSELAGIRRFVDHPEAPEDKVFGFSLHFHLSREGRDFSQLVPLLNTHRFLELAEQGRAEAALDPLYGYKRKAEEKGLYRLVARDRIESRTHAMDPATEIRNMVRLMDMPKGEAEAELSGKIQSLIARLEQFLRSTRIEDNALVRSALLALQELKPESDALARPGLEKIAFNHYSSQGNGSEQALSFFRNSRDLQPYITDLSSCPTVGCAEVKIRLISEWVNANKKDAHSIDERLSASIKDFLGKEFPASREVAPIWRQLSQGDMLKHLDKNIALQLASLAASETAPKCESFVCVRNRLGSILAELKAVGHLREPTQEFVQSLATTLERDAPRWPSLRSFDPKKATDLLTDLPSGIPESTQRAFVEAIVKWKPDGNDSSDWIPLVNWLKEKGTLSQHEKRIAHAILKNDIQGPKAEKFTQLFSDATIREQFHRKALASNQSSSALKAALDARDKDPSLDPVVRRSVRKLLEGKIELPALESLISNLNRLTWLSPEDLKKISQAYKEPQNFKYINEKGFSAELIAPLARHFQPQDIKTAIHLGVSGAAEEMRRIETGIADWVLQYRPDLIGEVYPNVTLELQNAQKELSRGTLTGADLVHLKSPLGKLQQAIDYLTEFPNGALTQQVIKNVHDQLPIQSKPPSVEKALCNLLEALSHHLNSSKPELAKSAIQLFDRLLVTNSINSDQLGRHFNTDRRILLLERRTNVHPPAPSRVLDTFLGPTGSEAGTSVSLKIRESLELNDKLKREETEKLRNWIHRLASTDDAIYAKAALEQSQGIGLTPSPELKPKEVREFRKLMQLLDSGAWQDLFQRAPLESFSASHGFARRVAGYRHALSPSELPRFDEFFHSSLRKMIGDRGESGSRLSAAIWTAREQKLADPKTIEVMLSRLNRPFRRNDLNDYHRKMMLEYFDAVKFDINDEAILRQVVRPPVLLTESEEMKLGRVRFGLSLIKEHPALAEALKDYLSDPSPEIRSILHEAMGTEPVKPSSRASRIATGASDCARYFENLLKRR